MKRIPLIILFSFAILYTKAQDVIITRSDEMIRAFNLEVGQTSVFYTLEESESTQVHQIDKSDIFIIKRSDGTKFDPNETLDNVPQVTSAAQEKVEPTPLDLSGFHGYLMGRGCNVYVTSHFGASYEQPAVDVIKQYLKIRKYWNVVESAAEAHFVIQFAVDITHDDYAVVVFRTRDAYLAKPVLSFGFWKILDEDEPGTMIIYYDDNGTEDGSINAQCARNMLNKNYLVGFEIEDDDPILESLRSGKLPSNSCFQLWMPAERDRGTVPNMWFRYGTHKNFWKQWTKFYKQ